MNTTVPPSAKGAATAGREIVLRDDGEYYIEHNGLCRPDIGNGFLLRRCAISLTTPGGYECVGHYQQISGGKWKARIDAPDDVQSDSDCIELGVFDSRDDAISALWQRRAEAFCRHK